MSSDVSSDPQTGQTTSVRIARQAFTDLPSMEEPGSIANARDIFETPGGARLSSGFFELEASEPLVYDYAYDEVKIVLEGELDVRDEATGTTTRGERFDVFFIPRGSRVAFSTPTRALALYMHD